MQRRASRQQRRRQDIQESNCRGKVMVGDKYWGEKNGGVRIVCQNINGLGFDKEGLNYIRLLNFLKEYNIDMIGVKETNVYWYKLAIKNRIFDKTKGWFAGRNVITAFNTTEPALSERSQQWGSSKYCHK